MIDRKGLRSSAKALGLDRATLSRVAGGLPVSARTIAVLDRISPRVRRADEFKPSISVRARPTQEGAYSWDLERIRTARNDQQAGVFERPVRLAEAMRTDDALFNPWRNRVSAGKAVGARLVPACGSRGETIARKAAVSVFVPRSVITGVHETLINHGIAIGYIERENADDGARVDFRLTEWPLEFVQWRRHDRTLITSTDGGGTIPIRHGDGDWVVFKSIAERPWTRDACLLPASFIWAGHAQAIQNWAGAMRSHGSPKVIGELPEGLALGSRNDSGAVVLEEEAQAFIEMMRDIVGGDQDVGIRPAGAKTDVLYNGSNAWQIFDTFTGNREKAGTRIYLGTDASLGSTGSSPGVDISQLFGLSTTILQGDLQTIQECLRTGLYEPWCAINEGSSQYAPSLRYALPDPDKEQYALQQKERRGALFDVLERYKSAGMLVDQAVVNALSAELGVDEPPQLAPAAEVVTVPLDLAPTDVAKVVRADEIRASQGLPPFGDERGTLTIPELDARLTAQADAAVKAAPAAPVPAGPAA